MRRCQELPGQHLFEYLDLDGKVRKISSTDVNRYLREKMGQEFGAKDFRTWNGSVLAGSFLSKKRKAKNATEAKAVVVECVKFVAENLRNTPATCRKYYIHPRIVELYQQGKLNRSWSAAHRPVRGLSNEERAFLSLCRTG